MGELPSNDLSESLKRIGFKLGRLKTGTPPRVCSETLDYSVMSVEPGDREFLHFLFEQKIQGAT